MTSLPLCCTKSGEAHHEECNYVKPLFTNPESAGVVEVTSPPRIHFTVSAPTTASRQADPCHRRRRGGRHCTRTVRCNSNRRRRSPAPLGLPHGTSLSPRAAMRASQRASRRPRIIDCKCRPGRRGQLPLDVAHPRLRVFSLPSALGGTMQFQSTTVLAAVSAVTSTSSYKKHMFRC
jgi:hypothetical protein